MYEMGIKFVFLDKRQSCLLVMSIEKNITTQFMKPSSVF